MTKLHYCPDCGTTLLTKFFKDEDWIMGIGVIGKAYCDDCKTLYNIILKETVE